MLYPDAPDSDKYPEREPMPHRQRKNRVLLMAASQPDGTIHTHMLSLGNELRRRGWDVAICSGGSLRFSRPHKRHSPRRVGEGSSADAVDCFEQSGMLHFEVPALGRPQRLQDIPWLPVLLPLALWQVLRMVRQFRPTVLHGHTRQMGTYARIAQVLLGVPFITSTHFPLYPTSRLQAATTFFGEMAVADSDEIRTILIDHFRVSPGRVRVVVPGVDTDRFRPPSAEERRLAQERYHLTGDQFVVAFVGSLIPRKRPDTLIRAIAEVVWAGHAAVALIQGRGPEETALRELSSGLGIEHAVRFLGDQDPRDVLWAADALALPSESEGSPAAVAEAMSSGVAVMCTSAGGMLQQITPDVSGTTFDYGDHRALATAMTRLINEPSLRATLVATALEDARDRLSSARMAQKIERIYLDVIDAQR